MDEDEDMPNLFGVESDDEPELVSLKYDTYSIEHHYVGAQLPNTSILELALLNKHHSLWAEFIYNAARLLADLMTGPGGGPGLEGLPCIPILPTDKCLELGAGAGLPGFIAALCGAKSVVISDYGNDMELDLIYPIDTNIQYVRSRTAMEVPVHAVAYTWGYPVHVLVHPDQSYQRPDASVDLSSYIAYAQSKTAARFPDNVVATVAEEDKFDKIILADLIFNRSEHSKLLWTVRHALKRDSGVCYVSFSHHDPAKAPLDMNFFTLAEKEFGFAVKCVGKVNRPTYPFREGDGLDEKRGDVHFYTLTLNSDA